MKDPRQYEHYVIYALLIVVVVLVGWLISSQNHSARYQIRYDSKELTSPFIFDSATGHLWLWSLRDNFVMDFGTVEKPYKKKIEGIRAKGMFDDLQPTEPEKK